MRPYKILYSPYKILELVERDIFSTESISPIYPVFLLTVATVLPPAHPIRRPLSRVSFSLYLHRREAPRRGKREIRSWKAGNEVASFPKPKL